MKKLKLTISGMHCASCAGNIERSLKKVEGVKNVSVSLMTNKAIVEAEESVSEDALKKAVAKTGYTVEDVQKI